MASHVTLPDESTEAVCSFPSEKIFGGPRMKALARAKMSSLPGTDAMHSYLPAES
jgi:hypothetical protein